MSFSAIPIGTCPLSKSEACRPAKIISKFPILFIAFDNTSTVNDESQEINDSFSIKTKLSAPIESVFFMTSFTKLNPAIITVMFTSCPSSLSLNAASVALRSNPLTIGGLLSSISKLFESAFTLNK